MLRRMLFLLLTFGLSCTFLHLGLPSDAEAQPMTKRKKPKSRKKKTRKRKRALKKECDKIGRDRAECKPVKTKKTATRVGFGDKGKCPCGLKYRQCLKKVARRVKYKKSMSDQDVDRLVAQWNSGAASGFRQNRNPCEGGFLKCMSDSNNPRIERNCRQPALCEEVQRDTLTAARTICQQLYRRRKRGNTRHLRALQTACVNRQVAYFQALRTNRIFRANICASAN